MLFEDLAVNGVSVFGLGYVGSICAATLAGAGHVTVGCDINPVKVDQINQGRSPVVEPGLDDSIRNAVESGLLSATTNTEAAVKQTTVTLVSVGTPAGPGGRPVLDALFGVCKTIGRVIRDLGRPHAVVVRSTIPPGTAARCIRIIESESGLRDGEDFLFAVQPEFMREGSGLSDIQNPPFTVVGSTATGAGELVASLYGTPGTRVFEVDLKTAEMLKYACNTFHAIKVAFANEIGVIAKAHDLDGRVLMDIFCQDDRLNISRHYLQPGFAFGGSCLPKDVSALMGIAEDSRVETPLIKAVLSSNEAHMQRALDQILEWDRDPVGFLGVSFKPGTDDVRNSPSLALAEAVHRKGLRVLLYEEDVRIDRLVGANLATFESGGLPNCEEVWRPSPEAVCEEAGIIVVTKTSELVTRALRGLAHHKMVLDLVGIDPVLRPARGELEGICW